MQRTDWRYSLCLLLFCLVAGAPTLWALQHQQLLKPAIWPLPHDNSDADKARMINLLYPLIRQHNHYLLKQRQRLQELLQWRQQQPTTALPQSDQAWLLQLAQRYELAPAKAPTFSSAWIKQLLRHVDIVPADLALAQAALESAWGRSRFALRANNYYGIWCFSPGCGLVPRQRAAGASHEVKAYASIAANVADYMLIINRNASYQRLRQLRAQLRETQQPLSGRLLSKGLTHYSGIGQRYVSLLQQLIRHNHLQRFTNLLTP